MQFVLSYFDVIKGPSIFLSFPEKVPSKIKNTIKGLFDLEAEDPFFEFILKDDNLKITNINFMIPSLWARGNHEMVMLSVITEISFNNEKLYDLLKEAAERIANRTNIFKSLYIADDSKDTEIFQKYEELKKIFLEFNNKFEKLRKEISILELVASKELTLSGACKVFGEIMIDMISCLLQQNPLVLCGDFDSSTALLSIFKRIFLDIFIFDNDLIVKDECADLAPGSYVINMKYGIVETGEISKDAHDAIRRYLQDAQKTGNNDAAIIFLRQKISILMKVADLLEEVLIQKLPEKHIFKEIRKHMKIKIKSDELYAVRLILKSRGRQNVADKILMSKFDKF
ncbi:MAG: hypothetical protein ACFFDK_14175 [Promethearchaeota archaeon]